MSSISRWTSSERSSSLRQLARPLAQHRVPDLDDLAPAHPSRSRIGMRTPRSVRDLAGSLVAGVGVADHARAGVGREHAVELLGGEVRAVRHASPSRRGSSARSRRRRRDGCSPRTRRPPCSPARSGAASPRSRPSRRPSTRSRGRARPPSPSRGGRARSRSARSARRSSPSR